MKVAFVVNIRTSQLAEQSLPLKTINSQAGQKEQTLTTYFK